MKEVEGKNASAFKTKKVKKSLPIYLYNMYVKKMSFVFSLESYHKTHHYINGNIQVWKTLKSQIVSDLKHWSE